MAISKYDLEVLKNSEIFSNISDNIVSYDSIRDYFFYVLATNYYDYKIVADSETLKLINIFKEIFENFPEEIPNGKLFKVNGKFISKENIPEIDTDQHILIVNSMLDDNLLQENINLINGIKEKNNIDDAHFGIWAHIGSFDAKHEGYEKYVTHCINKSLYKLYALIHASSQFINGYNVLCCKEEVNSSLGIISSMFERVYLNENDLLRKLNIKSLLIFLNINDEINNKYNIQSGLKLYEINNVTKAIPFIIVPSIRKEFIYDYFNDILNELGIIIPDELEETGKELELYDYCIKILEDKVVENFKAICSNKKFIRNEIKGEYLDLQIITLISNLTKDGYVDLNKIANEYFLNREEVISTLVKLIESNKLDTKIVVDHEIRTLVKRGNEYFHIPYEYMYQESYMFFETFLRHLILEHSSFRELAYELNEKYNTQKFTEYLEMKLITGDIAVDQEYARIFGINKMDSKYCTKYNPLDAQIDRSKVLQKKFGKNNNS